MTVNLKFSELDSFHSCFYDCVKKLKKRDYSGTNSPAKKKGLQKTICNPLILMVGQDRIELSTHGFSVRCSTD